MQITRIILYVKDVRGVAAFYERYFEMVALEGGTDRWTELAFRDGGCTIALHKASVAKKSGSAVKVVFGVEDVETFKKKKEQQGLTFSIIHKVDGVAFCNAKDPAGNSIQISNRGMFAIRP